MPNLTRRTALTSLSALSLMGLVACTMGGETAPGPAATSEGELSTVTPGKLTIATGEPAYSPWVENNNPESGEGFEAAVAYAVAKQLGFAEQDVVWVRTTFESAIAPGAKDWDFNIQQFSITQERKQAVDFSSPYYTTAQAVVALKDKVPGSTLADLKDVLFGVQVGTTSHTRLLEAVVDGKEPKVLNSSEDTVLALTTGQVDAIVVDLPTALYLVGTQLDNGVVVGQFANTTGGDEFALLLPKGSALTAPVTAAVDTLRADGTLRELETKWLTEAANIPVLS